MPVLPGGKLERAVPLAPGLMAHIVADRDWLDLRVQTGNSLSDLERKIAHRTLVEGYFEDIDVTVGDTPYVVSLASPCASAK
jgi:hypothetical protein